ncbi:MAG TPA: bifunctional helix-turn-helix transcriptional regulator/GNAT family N-acetyltransferase [Rhizomicrobium sp.]
MSDQPTELQDEFHEHIETIRRFNRLYTRRIGLLQKAHLGSPFSLTEARVLFELAHRASLTARDLCDLLALDQGYVSRILARFQKRGLISKRASAEDARAQCIALTASGRKSYAALDLRTRTAIAELLEGKPEAVQRDIAEAARTLERLLGEAPQKPAPLVIRPPKPGDLGWIVHRHGVLYAREYGWDASFEALVAEIVADFGKKADAARERCWVAERDGEILGAVFLVKDDDQTARLRLLYVEPAARGQGLGRQLVELCVAFARDAGYWKIVLWTHDVLTAARKIYQKAGFRLVNRDAHRAFGKNVVSENWALDLAQS